MPALPSEIAFTPAVKAQQARLGSRESYARWEQSRGFQQEISEELSRFVAERDSLYLGTASADGQPYVQHRGGPRGFLRVIGPRTLAFADFGGNRQYLSVGNLSENPRAFLFLMDYENAVRIKIWGTAEFVEDDPALLEALVDPEYGATPERAIRFHVEAWDKNCRQHIPKLVHEGERVQALQARVAELEQEVRSLRAGADAA
ncbi:MAG: pyridoxamine 5'-phosphate oxidase [Myxococcales bacterium]|nr:pyridoxamine 5'-phosphate oxidase [Myxococcales bacterium]